MIRVTEMFLSFFFGHLSVTLHEQTTVGVLFLSGAEALCGRKTQAKSVVYCLFQCGGRGLNMTSQGN